MKSINEIKSIAKSTINLEGQSILKLLEFIDDDFGKVVQEILKSKGRLIVTGIGKSANIAQKMVSTFNSTGQPSIFMHAADALHGDLGNIQSEDIVVCISKSGSTPEIKTLLPLLKEMGNSIIAITGTSDSYLSQQSDWTILSKVDKEACPNNLAPTTSTTAQLVIGDALAVCLLECRGFSDIDFAKYHPGGALGKKLFLKVDDLCSDKSKPSVPANETIQNVIVEISNKRLGATAVIENYQLIGVITDGDIRRMLENEGADWSTLKATDIMCDTPKTIQYNELASKALTIMEDNNISQLIVCKGDTYHGIVHIHDILKEGIL
ncbi:MAG: KpsF/GutQ family sugar-phosphate isomerase [Flavobacteriales bacterium]|nr:KpsF/GutQ family sugar-phosphate isomerase [Flavobacteriales bacterium]MBL6872915.1 KpsF/GutQ family sugar-phosphate isomerase [Flavobacteriales bacterium]